MKFAQNPAWLRQHGEYIAAAILENKFRLDLPLTRETVIQFMWINENDIDAEIECEIQQTLELLNDFGDNEDE
jgi:hypothetical protein